ncbi:hypothetical protein VP01_2717g2 [Puccinia sorghi]|uniref:Uncharacterized protein n=1 Tax=Puccinia sorghi TaxID=27349 RepID=A0A0L6V3E9_9BASI|nr:hypothetical protein VP01_2717g2 [Puccinia sorghi]
MLDRKDKMWIEEELNDLEREFFSEHCVQFSRKKFLDLEKKLIGYKMLSIMDSNKQDQSIPLPENPAQKQGPLQGIEDSLLDTPVPTPESSQFKRKEEVNLKDERKGIMLDTRNFNIHFDRSEVKIFIKCVEKVASMHGAGGRSARPSRILKEMKKGTGNYMMKIPFQTEDYRTFISDLEEILAYLKSMGYQNMNADSGKLWEKEQKWKPSRQKQGKISNQKYQNARALPPHFALPRQPAVGLRPVGTGTYQRPQIQCYYCKEAEHTVIFYPNLKVDFDKKFFTPNSTCLPMQILWHSHCAVCTVTVNQSLCESLLEKGLINNRSFLSMPTDTNKGAEDKKKANSMEWRPMEAPSMQMPTTSLISTNRWEMWSPPEMHYGEDDEDNHVGFGLRRSQQLGDKGKEKEKAEDSAPGKNRESAGKSLTAPPPNQEANKQPSVGKKRRPSYPGAWVEGDSDDESSGL